MDKPLTITIRFGQPQEDMGTDETVTFNTKAEADAFMLGVDLSNGWMSYEVTRDDRPGAELYFSDGAD